MVDSLHLVRNARKFVRALHTVLALSMCMVQTRNQAMTSVISLTALIQKERIVLARNLGKCLTVVSSRLQPLRPQPLLCTIVGNSKADQGIQHSRVIRMTKATLIILTLRGWHVSIMSTKTQVCVVMMGKVGTLTVTRANKDVTIPWVARVSPTPTMKKSVG